MAWSWDWNGDGSIEIRKEGIGNPLLRLLFLARASVVHVLCLCIFRACKCLACGYILLVRFRVLLPYEFRDRFSGFRTHRFCWEDLSDGETADASMTTLLPRVRTAARRNRYSKYCDIYLRFGFSRKEDFRFLVFQNL